MKTYLLLMVISTIGNLSLIAQNDLSGKVFIFGSDRYFDNEKCIFLFECDCCFDKALFVNDKIFIHVTYCATDITIQTGVYSLDDKGLILSFSGGVISLEQQGDEGGCQTENYRRIISSRDPTSLRFYIKSCSGPLFVYEWDHKKYLGVESKNTFEQELKNIRNYELREINEIVKDL